MMHNRPVGFCGERSATITTRDRKSYMYGRALEREEGQDHPKILLIGEAMVDL